MSYTFATKKNTAITVTLPVDSDVTGSTLTAEFSYKKSFSAIALTKSITGTGKTVTVSLSASEVDSLNDIHYRIKAVKAGVTSYIGSGDIDYQPGAEADAPKERYIPSRLSDAALKATFIRGTSYASLPMNWDSAWKTALATSSSAPAHVMFLGDSIVNGSNASAQLTNSWVAKLRNSIQSKYGVYGDYFSAWGLTPGFGNPSGATPYSTVAATAGYAEAGFGRAVSSSQTSGWFQTFTCPYNATGFDIVFVDYPSGTWQFDIDGGLGGSPTVVLSGSGASFSKGATTYTVTNAGTANPSNTAVRKVTVRGLAPGQHVIRVGQQSAANVLYLNGFNTYSGAQGGVFCSWIGIPSASACDWVTWRGVNTGVGSRLSTPSDKIALISGQYSNLNVSPYGVSNAPFGYPSAPHLLVTNWGVNDAASGTSVGSYQRAMRRFIQSARRGVDTCSWLHVAPAYGDSEYADNSISGRGYLYPTYKYAAAEITRSFGGAYVDIDTKWGELAVAKGFQAVGNLHPTDAGHTDIFNTLNSLVVI